LHHFRGFIIVFPLVNFLWSLSIPLIFSPPIFFKPSCNFFFLLHLVLNWRSFSISLTSSVIESCATTLSLNYSLFFGGIWVWNLWLMPLHKHIFVRIYVYLLHNMHMRYVCIESCLIKYFKYIRVHNTI
jgi:hypothetical protein